MGKFQINDTTFSFPDPDGARWDSVGSADRTMSGRMVALKRTGVTLTWENLTPTQFGLLMDAYIDLASTNFKATSVHVPPRVPVSPTYLTTWKRYTGFPVGNQGIWVDEPTVSYEGPLVKGVSWHFGNLTGLSDE